MTLLKGIASFPHILTEEDVLLHSYGISPGDKDATLSEPALAPETAVEEQAPVPEPEQAPVPEPEQAPVPTEPETAPTETAPTEPGQAPSAESPSTGDPAPSDKKEDAELTDEELSAKLEAENNKPALVTMAEAAGVDAGGTKAEIAARLVAHYRAPK